MGPIVPWIVGAAAAKKFMTPSAPPAAEAPAATPAPSATTESQQTGVETAGEALKRRARGKRNLMISPGSSGSGSGTGLNI